MTFADVTALTGTGPWVGTVDPEWTIGGKPNGGYLLAMLARAALEVVPHEHVLTASAVYVGSPEPGPVTITADVLRTGRSASQIRARMLQGERLCVEALVTAATLDPASEPYWSGGVPTPPDADRERAIRVPGVNPLGLRVAIMDQVDLRLDRETLGFGRGQPTGAGELRGWLALPGDVAFDTVSLLYALDALPPATFDIELTGWVPTLELTAYVRALPAPGPVRIVQRAHLIEAQRVDESCWVYDSRGRAVAHAYQLAGVRLG